METASFPRMGLIAGEASGDLLGSRLLTAMKTLWPGLEAQGVGGTQLMSAGLQAWGSADRLAVHGLVDALKAYPELLSWRRALGTKFLAWRPDVFVGVDAPDFNFGLERRLREGRIKTVHFVSPSIWAWRKGRLKGIVRSVDHMLCLFPFEPAIYREAGVAATFVGHPMADEIPESSHVDHARARLGLGTQAPVVALLPGSRRAEIENLMPRFARAALIMRRLEPALRFVIPAAPGRRERIDQILTQCAPDLLASVVDGRSHETLAACDVTMIASGTATLEAALFKRPMVVAYAQHGLSHWLMKRMAYLPWISLPNILAQETLVPELIQGAATPEALARETFAWLQDHQRVAQVRERFSKMHHTLRQNAALRAAEVISDVIRR